jgi:hypothetical protein
VAGLAEDNPMNLTEIAKALHVPLPWLLTGKTRPSKPKLKLLPGGKAPAPTNDQTPPDNRA